MEKSIVVIIFCCFTFLLKAQDSLCVFKLNGSAYVKTTNKLQPLSKGKFINKNQTLILDSSSKLTAINASGEAYKVESNGQYKFKDILKLKTQQSGSLTSKYFKVIWDEFVKKEEGSTVIGGVFRGDILMEFPKDSVMLASSKLTFSWKTNEVDSSYYVFVRNKKTDEILKLATNGNQISLYKNQTFFSEDNTFEWIVTTEEFPSLDNLTFYNFELINRNQYAEQVKNYTALLTDLEALGLSDAEIETTICETYGLCK